MDKFAAIGATLALAVVITAATLPGRQTPALTRAVGNLYASAAYASEGIKR